MVHPELRNLAALARLGLARGAAALAAALALAACSSGGGGGAGACTVDGVTVVATPASLVAGATTTLTATVVAGAGCGDVAWTASPAGGTLTPSGLGATFSSPLAGTFTIRATSVSDPSRSGTATVTVTAPQACVVNGVTVSATPASVETNAPSALTAALDFTGPCVPDLDWTVDPPTATLTPAGAAATFAAAAAGVYTVTATSVADPTASGTAVVTVTAPVACLVSGLSLSATPPAIDPGGTTELTATLDATASCTRALSWQVQPAGGTLTPSGATAAFTAASGGPYTVTVTSDDAPGVSASAVVSVNAPPACAVTGVAVGASPASMATGATSTLAAQVTANAGCTGGVTWSVAPPTGGTLTPSGTTASFTAGTAGTYTITATSTDDGARSGSATVTVVAPAPCAVNAVTVTAAPAAIASGGTALLSAAVDAGATCTKAVTWSATPAGGTLTATGASARFTAAAQGTYTVTATSVDDAARSGSATVVVGPAVACGLPNGTEIEHRGDVVADEVWAGGGVTHLVPATVNVRGTAVLTIEACAIVKLAPRVTMTVLDQGRLVSAGTGDGRRVVFEPNFRTALRWGMLRAFGPTALLDLRFTTLREGGEMNGIAFDPSISAFGAGHDAAPAPILRVEHVSIEGSSGLGVYLDLNATFTPDSHDLTIVGAGSNPVYASMMSLGGLPRGSYAGNARKEGTDEILVRGPDAEVFSDLTIKALGVPYRLPFATVPVRSRPPATAPVTLTLEPGVILKFPRVGAGPGARLTLGGGGAVGVLSALGTAAQPILLTSGEDVSPSTPVPGVESQPGTPAPGDWAGVWLADAPGSRLDHVQISFAGGASGVASASCRPTGTGDDAALLVGDLTAATVPSPGLLTNSTISDSAGHGISAVWLAPAFDAPDLTGTSNAISAAPGHCRQTYNGLTAGTCPAGGGCTVP